MSCAEQKNCLDLFLVVFSIFLDEIFWLFSLAVNVEAGKIKIDGEKRVIKASPRRECILCRLQFGSMDF